MRRALALLATVLLAHSTAIAQSSKEVVRIPRPKDVRIGRIDFSRDGKRMAVSCSDHRIRVWQLPSGEFLRELESGEDRISAMAFSPDGGRLAVGSPSGDLRLLDVANGGLVAKASTGSRAVVEVMFAPRAPRLAVLPEGTPGQLWALSPLERRGDLATDFGGSVAVDFSPDGRMLATADEDTHVRIYRAEDGRLQAASNDFVLEPFTLGFARRGEWVVVGGADGRLTLIDPATGKTLRQLARQPDPVAALAVLGEGRTAAAAYFHADAMSRPAPLLLWDLDAGSSRVVSAEARIQGGGRLNDGRLRLVTLTDEEFMIWDLP